MESLRVTQGLLDARATFQRLCDARIVRGWIVDVDGPRLLVRATDDAILSIGEQFAARTARLNGDVAFIVVLRDAAFICAEDSLRRAESFEGPTMLDFGDRTYTFEIMGKMVPMPATGDPRYLCDPCRVTVGQAEAELRDVSPTGMGIITLTKHYVGERVHVRVEEASGTVEVEAEVMYCRQLATLPALYRVGLQVLSMGRIERARWMRVVKERSRPRDRSRFVDDPAPLVEPRAIPRPEETGIVWALQSEIDAVKPKPKTPIRPTPLPREDPVELWEGREGVLSEGSA